VTIPSPETLLMKRILIRTAISLLIVMLLMGLVGLILPSSFAVEAKATVQAPADDIYQLLITPRSWVDWSPWNKQAMPELESTYKGPESGVGARWEWTDPAGDGSLEITAAADGASLDYLLTFEGFSEPMRSSISLQDVEAGTEVVWTAAGDVGYSPLMRWMNLFMGGIMEREYVKAIEGVAAAAAKTGS
jgi:hypothetical protein